MRRATLSLALRERGLTSISSLLAIAGRLVKISISGRFSQRQTGILVGQIQELANFRKVCLTRRSSRE